MGLDVRTARSSLRCAMLICALGGAATWAEAEPPATYELLHGRWFDGHEFVSKTLYSVAGVLADEQPARVDESVDLAGGFVIPPLAEGHNHWLEPNRVGDYVACYLRDGVFYVKDQGNTPYLVSQFRDRVNHPTSVEFVSALQGFTGPGGHPLQLAIQLQQAFGLFPAEWEEADFDRRVVMVVASEADIDERWPILMQGSPAFVKSFLQYSDRYEAWCRDSEERARLRERIGDPACGMDPALLPGIVRRAHARGLEVSVHIYSAADFRNALQAGVDEIAHFPGLGFDPELGLGMAAFVLAEEDARAAAAASVRVLTTLHGIPERLKENPKTGQVYRDEIILPNLRLLKKHAVPILLGSDQFRHSPIGELFVLRDLGVFSNLELLQIAVEATPAAVFPHRKIGHLLPGYEASFLVLAKDPLQNLDHLKTITLRVKNGRRLGPNMVAAGEIGSACVEQQ